MSNPSPGGNPDPYQPQPPYGQPDPQQGYHQDPGYPAPGYQGAGYPPPGHQAPGYPSPGYQAAGTNVMAILSLVFAFVFSPAGIVLGHLAKKQIRQTGEQGDQLATWGLVLSYIFTGLSAIACCAAVGLIIMGASTNGTGGY